jgi:hypothetical protein
MRRNLACVAMIASLLVVSGCTDGPATPAGPLTPSTASDLRQPSTQMPDEPTMIIDAAAPVDLAVAASRALYATSPAVVLVAEDDEASLAEAETNAVDLGIPLLLTPVVAATDPTPTPGAPDEVAVEIERLGVRTLVTVGDSAGRWAAATATASNGSALTVAAPAAVTTGDAARPEIQKPPALDGLLVLALDQPAGRAAAATARASGARVLLLPDPDPRTSSDAVTAIAGQPSDRVLAIGEGFGTADLLRQRIDTAATGVLLPGGGQVLFPGRRMVALYGHPGSTALGSLGEQSLEAAIERARTVAGSYQSLVDEPVVPAFEIIATVASRGAGADGDYSSESTIAHLKPWVEAAGAAGMYVLLDLQPGRTDFLTQAKLYTELLELPHVGLALDPEWRLAPGEVHLVQIGSVSAAEINNTAAWLAELTRENRLPQKVLMLHQFRLDMITERSTVNTSHDELKIVIHADGFGSAGQKYATWNNMHNNAPPNVWWGWKNFYDEDRPTFTPGQTVAVSPSPVFISYQ